jgi:hypothetical protein
MVNLEPIFRSSEAKKLEGKFQELTARENIIKGHFNKEKYLLNNEKYKANVE